MPGRPRTRVLQLIASMHIGGQERVVANLARGLDRSRFDVAVCCSRELGVLAEQLRSDGFEVLLAAPPTRRLRHLTPWYVRRAINTWETDIVHGHGTISALHAGPLAMLGAMPPWIHTFHYGNYDAAKGKLFVGEKLFCRAATRLVAVSDAQRLAAARYHGLSADRLTTIINGVRENPNVADPQVRGRKRAELGVADAEFVVGTLAVLTVQKGIADLLAAMREVITRSDRVRLVIVGGGPLEVQLRAEAGRLGIERQVTFTGWRDDALELITAFDAYAMPSLWEAMPMALLEALAARRPVVVTDVGDNSRVVEDGRCGLVVPRAAPRALAAALLRLAADPALCETLATRAYERFRSHYTIEHMVQAYEQLYDDLHPRQ